MPIGSKDKLNFIHGWKSPERKCSFFTALWRISCSVRGHLRTFSWFSQVVWGLGSLLAHIPQHPAVPNSHTHHAQRYRFNPEAPALPLSVSPHVPQPHVGDLSLPTCSQQPLLSWLPLPPRSTADTFAESPSVVKGALTSASELAFCSRHQAQARAKEYNLSEARLNLCGRPL